jgi:hypothetical protein
MKTKDEVKQYFLGKRFNDFAVIMGASIKVKHSETTLPMKEFNWIIQLHIHLK